MLKVLVLAALVAVASAAFAPPVSGGLYCGDMWIHMLKVQWAQAYGTGLDRETFAQKLWQKVFKAAPEVRALFSNVRGDNINSAEFRAHALRVLGGLDMSISLLDNKDAFEAEMSHLNAQHKPRGIDAAYYTAFKTALMEVVPEVIGLPCYKFDSWSLCLDEILNRLKA